MERETKYETLLALSQGLCRLFKFQCGTFQLADGRYITVGVPGMSDLQGWYTIQVTPEMVGLWIPVYSAIELKSPGSRTHKIRLERQKSFLAEVKRHGGLAGFAHSVDEAKSILNQSPGVVVCPDDQS